MLDPENDVTPYYGTNQPASNPDPETDLDPHQSEKLDPDPHPHLSNKLDPDPEPHQFADDNPKCMEYEPFSRF